MFDKKEKICSLVFDVQRTTVARKEQRIKTSNSNVIVRICSLMMISHQSDDYLKLHKEGKKQHSQSSIGGTCVQERVNSAQK